MNSQRGRDYLVNEQKSGIEVCDDQIVGHVSKNMKNNKNVSIANNHRPDFSDCSD